MKIMKIILIGVILCVIMLFLAGAHRNSLSAVMRAITVGSGAQSMKLSIEYAGFIPVGAAQFEDIGTLKATVRTNDFIDRFFKLRAQVIAQVDRESLLPLQYEYSYTANGSLKDEKKVLYDQVNHRMQTLKENRVIQPQTRDPLSLMLYLKHENLAVGQTIDLNINTNQKNYRFLAHVLKKDTITKGTTDFEIYMIKGSVKRSDKTTGHATDFTLWYMDKPVKSPVLIKAFTGAGVVVARAIEVQ
jgi:hypothetical protein